MKHEMCTWDGGFFIMFLIPYFNLSNYRNDSFVFLSVFWNQNASLSAQFLCHVIIFMSYMKHELLLM